MLATAHLPYSLFSGLSVVILVFANSGLQAKHLNVPLFSPQNLKCLQSVLCVNLSCVFSRFFSELLSFLPSSRPPPPNVCLFQPSCLDDPDREQRIKELELLLMSAENEVQRQVQCRGPSVRTHSQCVLAFLVSIACVCLELAYTVKRFNLLLTKIFQLIVRI